MADNPTAPLTDERVAQIARAVCPFVKPWLDDANVVQNGKCDCRGHFDDPEHGPSVTFCMSVCEDIAKAALSATKARVAELEAAYNRAAVSSVERLDRAEAAEAKLAELEARMRALTAALDQSNADNGKMRTELLKRHEQDIRDGDRDSEGW